MIPALRALNDLLPTDRYTDREAVLAALERFLEASALTHWLFVSMPMPGGDLRQYVLRARWPEAWLVRYLRDDFMRADPMINTALGARMALDETTASELSVGHAPGVDVLAEHAAHGLKNLITVPSLKINGYLVVGLLASSRPLGKDEVYMVAAGIRLLVDRLHQIAPEALSRGSQLTARERQIVTMTATGLTSNEIAAELGISARTVFAHLTSAGDKLRAANKTETVVNAYRLGQIAL